MVNHYYKSSQHSYEVYITVLIIHHPSMCLSPTNYLHLESKKIPSLLPDNTEIR